MPTMTKLCTWNNLYPWEISPADGICQYLGEFAGEHDVDSLASDLADALNGELEPHGIVFVGAEFLIPAARMWDEGWEPEEIIREAVDSVWVYEDSEATWGRD